MTATETTTTLPPSVRAFHEDTVRRFVRRVYKHRAVIADYLAEMAAAEEMGHPRSSVPVPRGFQGPSKDAKHRAYASGHALAVADGAQRPCTVEDLAALVA